LAVFDPEQLHAEHNAWRETILTMPSAPAAVTQADLLAATMCIHHKLIDAGLVPPEVH
jgi:hypothetical protein